LVISASASGGNGTGTYSYASSDANVASIGNDGSIVLVGVGTTAITAFRRGDQNYNDSGLSSPVTFTVLPKIGLTDEQKVAADKDALTWDVIKGANTVQTNVTSNLSLPTSGENGSAIVWQSSDTAVISTTGAVTRPAYEAGNKTVTLKATITSGNASDTKEFTITVIAQPSSGVPITSMVFDAPSVTTVVHGMTYRFSVTVNPGALPDGVVFSVSSELFAAVNGDGSITIKNRTGSVLLTATAPNGVTCSVMLRIV
jgi:hypothetical protein